MNFWNHNYAQIAKDSGFKLQKSEDGALDWKLLGPLDIDRIVKEQNFEEVENVIYHLAEVPLGILLNNQILDSGVTKYFHLSQLSIQYLLFCVKFLDETVYTLRNSLKILQNEKNDYKQLFEENSQQLLQLNKKIQHLENINQIVYPCSICTKNFISNEMLNIHMTKRHSSASATKLTSAETDRNLINTIKLELEIKQLKERLNLTEKELRMQCKLSNNHNHHHHLCSLEENKSKMDAETNTKDYGPTTLVPIEIQTSLPSASVNNASTQTIVTSAIHANSIGIQNNLDETKEKDDITTDDFEQKIANNFEIFSEIKEKLTILEDWRNNYEVLKQNENIMNPSLSSSSLEICNKLNKILNSIENISLKQKDDNNLERIETQTIISENREFFKENIQLIQNTINENILKFYQDNEKKLNEILKKFEILCLKEENSKIQEIVNVNRKHENVQFDRKSSKNIQFNRQTTIRDDNNIVTTQADIHSSDELLNTNDNFIKLVSDNEKDISVKSSEVFRNIKEIEEIDSKQNSETEQSSNSMYFTKDIYQQMLDNHLKKLGINRNDHSSLTVSSRSQILKKLEKSHESQKMRHPNFFVVRNALKSFVHNITIENTKTRKESKTKIKDHNQDIVDSSTMKQNLNGFKQRLEKILESPIRKPKTLGDWKQNQMISNGDTVVNNELKINVIKPIPVPRKTVTFQ